MAVELDASLVRRLLTSQFPLWADLPILPTSPQGWDNRTFRLGDDLSVRLPSAEHYAPQVAKEHEWLPRLALHLPLPIPTPLALGEPAEGYPWRWSVYRWIEGAPAEPGRIADLPAFARAIGGFLGALQAIDARDGPAAGPHCFWRGGPLATYDAETRAAIATLADRIDAAQVTEVWDAAIAAAWTGPPVWFHGDVAVGNLLTRDGALSAVIDFGCCGVGDPACDLVLAWTLFEGESRTAFRATLPLDPGTWARGRGWALWKALLRAAGPANPAKGTANSGDPWRILCEVLADHRREVGR